MVGVPAETVGNITVKWGFMSMPTHHTTDVIEYELGQKDETNNTVVVRIGGQFEGILGGPLNSGKKHFYTFYSKNHSLDISFKQEISENLGGM